jgi:hypothetical protein
MGMWSTVLMEAWKRRQSEIAHAWNMDTQEKDETVRTEFQADVIIDTDTRTAKKVNTVSTYLRRIFGEIPIITVSISAVIACFVGNFLFQRKHKDDSSSTTGSSVISAVVIIVLDKIYRYLATMMANWENHKYGEDYENSLITKNYAFTFVNSNIALFSVAFA